VINDVQGSAITHMGIALTFGLVVMAMIYAIGDISGAHINRAVTIAFWIARRFEGSQVLPYLASQLLGAFVASGILRVMFVDHGDLGSSLPAGPWVQYWMYVVAPIAGAALAVLSFRLVQSQQSVSDTAPDRSLHCKDTSNE